MHDAMIGINFRQPGIPTDFFHYFLRDLLHNLIGSHFYVFDVETPERMF